jgi:hypothetical protein
MFGKNRFVKFIFILTLLYYAAVLVFIGVTLAISLKGSYNGVAAYHVLDGWLPAILMLDFWLRFILQETPANQAKPYTLMPIRRSFLMRMYLNRSALSIGNMFWGFMLIPFGLIAIAIPLGWIKFAGWLLGWWILCIANGFCYLFVRTLLVKHLAWITIPIIIHGAIIAAMFVPDNNWLDMPCTLLMDELANWKMVCFLAIIAVVALLYYSNYLLLTTMVYNEIGNKENVEVKKTAKMTFLNRYGRIGEYMKLEVRTKTRNKNVKIQFATGLSMMLVFCLMMFFTDAYSSGLGKSYVCLYNYIVLGVITLGSIMCHEGNYIDGLMSRRESIYDLLRAKYYFNSLLLVIPPILFIPLMIKGELSVWMNLGYLFFTIGVLYPFLFQMAVYNKDTLPLNKKITGKQNSVMQKMVTLAIFLVPVGIERLSIKLLGEQWGYLTMICLGAIGFATHKIWLRNIYKRFMVRRYVNMEGYRATRNS